MAVYLQGPRYVLGDTRVDHGAIENLEARAEEFRMAPDPALINLVDRIALGHVLSDRFYLLASSVPGSRMAVLLQRFAD
jgi:hypothetical protein